MQKIYVPSTVFAKALAQFIVDHSYDLVHLI